MSATDKIADNKDAASILAELVIFDGDVPARVNEIACAKNTEMI